MSDAAEEIVKDLFSKSGVEIGGNKPWDIKVRDKRFYARVLADGSLGFGESYMDGWWDCQKLDECIFRLYRSDTPNQMKKNVKLLFAMIHSKLFNRQNKSQASKDVQSHYNIGNDLYKLMLDKRMVYTCAYWKKAKNLEQAQEAKLDLVCKKIGLKPGDKILDLGCGWGSFAKYAAEKYKVSVLGVTISEEQVKLGKELCKGLPVEIRLQDYRDVKGKFDHVVSIGMLEHVGYKNYRECVEVAHRCLKDDGLFLLHTIGNNTSQTHADPWVDKYIFPGSMTPSVSQIGKAIEGLFVMEDWHNIGAYYDPTLMAWWHNFDKNWGKLKEKYGERFYRMWKFYLVGAAGISRARGGSLWQIVLSKKGVVGGYNSVR